MNNFTSVGHKYVIKCIRKSPSKSCEMDSIPTEIPKDIAVEISPLLTVLINFSLENGLFQDKLKEAFLRMLLLKKINLDPIKRNYRLISNLAFVGKLIECITSKQIISHIKKHNLMEKNQSVYQEYHSTETTLIKVKSSILNAMDNQEVTCLVLPDLSAAFNKMDHGILLNRLNSMFGIEGIVLKWIESHITGKTQILLLETWALTSVYVLI